jgi:hypothetical protein
VFSTKCTYRHRVHSGGHGWLASIDELADASRDFLRLLDEDPTLRKFAAAEPTTWQDLKQLLTKMTWETYLWRWRDLYRHQLSGPQWIKAAFAFGFIPPYYRSLLPVFRTAAKERVKRFLTREPATHEDFFAGATKKKQ